MLRARAERAASACAVLALVCSLVFGFAASAQTPRSASELFRAGQYEAAMNTGIASADAAWAALAWASFRDTPCGDCLKRAEDAARSAIAAEPKSPRAYVAFVAVIGFESRLAGTFASRRARYAEQAKEAADKALALAPDDPWALAAMGGWHIEVVRAAGRIAGGFLYDAHYDTGAAFFQRAASAAPDDPVVQLNYALALSSYRFNRERAAIETALAAAARANPRDAYGQTMKMRAATLLDLLRKDDRRDYLTLMSRYLGFPDRSAF
jgi:tetratricopeptide (TPR) repeat protein